MPLEGDSVIKINILRHIWSGRHGRYVTFQLAEVAVPRNLFREILRRIDDLRPRPPPVQAEEIHGEV